MLCHKKIVSSGVSTDNEEPIDFCWIIFIGINRLGFTPRQVGHLTLGAWTDYFETYKKQYNFETKKGLYTLREAEPISSLDVL